LVNLDINSFWSAKDKRCITTLSPFAAGLVGMFFTPFFMATVAYIRARKKSREILATEMKHNLTEHLAETEHTDESSHDDAIIDHTVTQRTAQKASDRALVEVCMYSYLGTSQKAMSTLFCRTVDDVSFVAMDMGHMCHDASHVLMILLALLVLVVLTFGLPLIIVHKALQFTHHTRTQRDPKSTAFVRVINLFNARHKWWMAWLLLRRALLAAAFVYGQVTSKVTIDGVEVDWRAIAFVILMISSILQTRVMPFRLPADNMLEQVSLLMLMMALYLDIADESVDNRIARIGILVSILVVAQALLSGESPIAKKIRQTVNNPRDSINAAVIASRNLVSTCCDALPCYRNEAIEPENPCFEMQEELHEGSNM
jgi:hypothetical protein